MRITHVNQRPVNGVTGIGVHIVSGGRGINARDPVYQMRYGTIGARDGSVHGQSTLEFTVSATGGAWTQETFGREVQRMFAPQRGDADLSTIVHAQLTDETPVWIRGDVTNIQPRNNSVAEHRVTLQILDRAWQDDTTQIEPVGEDVTGGGEAAAVPSIVITPALATLTRQRVYLYDGSGWGVMGYPYGITGLTLPQDPNRIMVYMDGAPVFFNVDGQGRLWVRASLRRDYPAIIDVYAGDAINNDITANRLDLGGISMDSTDVALWAWEHVMITRNLDATGAWQPTLQGYANQGGFAVVGETMQLVNFDMSTTGIRLANAMTVSLGVPAGGILTGLRMMYRPRPEHHARVFVRIIKPNSRHWEDIFTQTVAHASPEDQDSPSPSQIPFHTMNINHDVTGAIAIAIGIEGNPSRADRPAGELIVDFAPGSNERFTVQIDGDYVPHHTVSDPVPAALVHGFVRNETTGQWLRLDRFYIDETNLIIDCDRKLVWTHEGPWYMERMLPSRRGEWFLVEPDECTYSVPSGVTAEFHYRRRYLR